MNKEDDDIAKLDAILKDANTKIEDNDDNERENQMAINFSDPAQTTHQNKPIPINTQQKYDDGLAMMKSYHAFYAQTMDADALEQYDKRVLNGLTIIEIQTEFGKDMVSRYNVTL